MSDYWRTRAKQLEIALRLCDHYCEHLHHEKKHQHKAGEPCPVEKIITEALYPSRQPQAREENNG